MYATSFDLEQHSIVLLKRVAPRLSLRERIDGCLNGWMDVMS